MLSYKGKHNKNLSTLSTEKKKCTRMAGHTKHALSKYGHKNRVYQNAPFFKGFCRAIRVPVTIWQIQAVPSTHGHCRFAWIPWLENSYENSHPYVWGRWVAWAETFWWFFVIFRQLPMQRRKITGWSLLTHTTIYCFPLKISQMREEGSFSWQDFVSYQSHVCC